MGMFSVRGRFSLAGTFWLQTDSRQLERNCREETQPSAAERPKGSGVGIGVAKVKEQSSPTTSSAYISSQIKIYGHAVRKDNRGGLKLATVDAKAP